MMSLLLKKCRFDRFFTKWRNVKMSNNKSSALEFSDENREDDCGRDATRMKMYFC